MREKFSGTSISFFSAFGISIEVGVLPLVSSSGVSLGLGDGVELAVDVGELAFDVLVEAIVLRKLCEDVVSLLIGVNCELNSLWRPVDLTMILAVPNQAYEHSAKLASPVQLLGLAMLALAVKIADALVVGLLIELV